MGIYNPGATLGANTFTGTQVYPGVTDASNAAAGVVGEFLSTTVAIGSAVALTTTTAANVMSLSLTAGDWDVWGQLQLTGGGSTVLNGFFGNINLTSGTIADNTSGGYIGLAWGAVSPFGLIGPISVMVPPRRFNVSSTTSVFMNAEAIFSVSTCSAYGGLFARRRR